MSLRKAFDRTTKFKTTVVLTYNKDHDKRVMKLVRELSNNIKNDKKIIVDLHVTTEGFR